jgi:hypothetical protein
MAFKSYIEARVLCDKCGKPTTEEAPAFVFVSTMGRGGNRGYHEIRLHKACLDKVIAKLEVA